MVTVAQNHGLAMDLQICEDQQWDCDLTCYDNDGGDCGDGGSDPFCGDSFVMVMKLL